MAKENYVTEIKTQEPKKGYKIDDSSGNVEPRPILELEGYKSCGKLKDKVAFITGGDSGIGAAAAIAFAHEGADVVISYFDSQDDANSIVQRINEIGRRSFALQGDVGSEDFAVMAVEKTVKEFGRIDILVNNAAEQHESKSIRNISAEQLDRTFRTNIFSMFYMVKAALPHMPEGSSIINSTSVTAYKGSGGLLDYSSTKGAIVSFTRSLAINDEIVENRIRVNGVAPGPIWTPLIPATTKTFDEQGKDVLMERAGQPYEVAPAYVFLAGSDSSYMTGQVLHVNGGTIVNG
jgi:NAD(P)-dependent dehydrogenase (short-subunit alcohol dehydrogenase family)